VPQKVVEFNETVEMYDPIRSLRQWSFQKWGHSTDAK